MSQSVEGLRAMLLDLGYDAARRAKLATDPTQIRDLIEAAADALRSVSDADQKAATTKAVAEAQRAMSIGMAGYLDGRKSGMSS